MSDLNFENLILVLSTASGQQRGQNQTIAEQQLKKWESVKGYHFLLQSVYNDTNQPLPIRWLSVICLKNGVERYWRSSRINAISKDEKAEIRSNLFRMLDEQNNQLCIQNAHSIARISRFDFPTEWPTLFDDFASLLQNCNISNSLIRLHNILIILNQVLKVLSTVRIGRGRAAMQSKIFVIMPHLIKYYHILFEKTANNQLAEMEVGYLSLKNIRRAIVDGFDYPHRDKLIMDFFETSLSNFQKMLIAHENTQLELLERYLKCYVKLYYNLVQDNPTAFLLMPCSKDILITLLSLLEQKAPTIYNNNSEFWDQIAIKSFLMLKKITTFGYKKGAMLLKQRNDKEEIKQATKIVTDEIFSESLLLNLVNLIINWYLKLKPIDLENWSNEPEEWINEELQTNYEFQVRPCAENYFEDLSTYFKDVMSPFILNKIQVSLSDPNTDMLSKDAILCVFELSSNSICDSCNFDELFTNVFLPEVIKDNTSIIKRRACLIISEWISIRCSNETRLQIYKFLGSLLETSNDTVVKLTAIQTLQHLVDDWEFRKSDFQPFIGSIIMNMITTLSELELTESKMFILKVLSVVIERCNPTVPNEVLDEILKVIPIMWDRSDDKNEMIIKNSLLRLLRDLTNSFKDENVSTIHSIVLPLITICCDESSEYYSLLCEDAFEMWNSTLKNIPIGQPIPEQLINDFPLVIKGLLNWTEILPLVLNIIRSYAILDYKLFETEQGLEVFKIIGGYLNSMRDDSIDIASQLIEILILQTSNDYSNNASNSKIVVNLMESGLLNELINYISRESQAPTTETKLCLPLLRLILLDSEFFYQLLDHITTRSDEFNLSIRFNNLVISLMDHLKLVYDSKIRKLFLLGLISFYTKSTLVKYITRDPSVDLNYQLLQLSEQEGISLVLTISFNKVMFLFAHFFEEVSESSTGDCARYHMPTTYDDDYLTVEEVEGNKEVEEENEYAKEYELPKTNEFRRFNLILNQFEPIFTVNLKEYFKFKFDQVINKFEGFGYLMDGVDKETIQQLELIL